MFVVISCGDSGIDTRMSGSDFFVAFDTKNGVFASASITEGDTAVIAISMGATKGSSVSVEFDLAIPTVDNPLSAEYKLLTMDDQEMTEKKLTFPEGTGIQKFKFVTYDNDLAGDGTRTFTFKLLSNSAGYTIGVGANGEASEYKVNVLDDDIWNPVGTGSFVSAAFGGKTFPVDYYRSILDNNTYKMSGMFTNDIVFAIDPDAGKATVEAQSLGDDIFGVGSDSWIRCTAGLYSNGVCTFSGGTFDNAYFTSSSMGSGLQMANEQFVLPAGSY